MSRQPFRVTPNLPVEAVKTYAIDKPIATHFRRATCREVACGNYVKGWVSVFDESTDLGAKQARYVRDDRSRKAVEMKSQEAAIQYAQFATLAPGLTCFIFPPGQKCFEPHQVPVGRKPIYSVRGGDWRGATSERRVFSGPDAWVDDFGEHQHKLARAQEA